MRKRYFLLVVCLNLFIACPGTARDFSGNSDRSFFIGFDLGAGLNPGKDSRSPDNIWDLYPETLNDPAADPHPEALSLAAFLFGIYGGYRFDEMISLEAGWHEQQHDTHQEWGGSAYYRLFHLALRLALPSAGRQTLLFRVGPALGGFTYGGVGSGFDDVNSTFVLGGLAGISMEHEFALGVVGVLEAAYIPSYRYGMDHILLLQDHIPKEEGGYEVVDLDEKDFSKGQFIHILWLSIGFQFEWTFR